MDNFSDSYLIDNKWVFLFIRTTTEKRKKSNIVFSPSKNTRREKEERGENSQENQEQEKGMDSSKII